MLISGIEDTPIDSANPSSKEDFDKLREAINNKVQDSSKAEHYVEFVTELVENMVINCKYGLALQQLYFELKCIEC